MNTPTPVRSTPAVLAAAVVGFALPTVAQPPARLAVVVVLDQIRAEAVERIERRLPDGDFGGLRKRGSARFVGEYHYGATETAPGHATLATGANPPVHGICANGWFDADGYRPAVFDDAHPIRLDDDEKAGLQDDPPAGVSARALRAPTLADSLRRATASRGRVVSISLKDRAAVLSAGRAGDVVTWFSDEVGRFVTSDAYPALPSWVNEGFVDPAQPGSLGVWTPAAPIPAHVVDDREGEADPYGIGRTFPHDFERIEGDRKRRGAFRGTPAATERLFAVARAAVTELSLGADDEPDLLVLSVSTTDYVGHWFGPRSAESEDLLLRVDAELRGLLAHLDRSVGSRGFVLAVTADHGVMDLVELGRTEGFDAHRIQKGPLVTAVDEAVEQALRPLDGAPVRPEDGWVRGLVTPHLHLDGRTLSPDQLAVARAAATAAVQSLPGVARVIDARGPADDRVAQIYLGSVHPSCTGDLLLHPSTGSVFTRATGTNHGSAWGSDRHVPLLLVGAGVPSVDAPAPVDVRRLAPTLARWLGVAPPDGADQAPLPVFPRRTWLP